MYKLYEDIRESQNNQVMQKKGIKYMVNEQVIAQSLTIDSVANFHTTALFLIP